MPDALVRHPHVGTVWLNNAKVVGEFVEGEVWDDSMSGSAYMPDDFMGEPVVMHFKATCVVKWVGE